MIKGFVAGINEYVSINKLYFLGLLILFLLGASAGIFTVNGLTKEDGRELADYVNGFVELSNKEKVDGKEIFKISIMQNGKLVLLIFALGVSIIGIPFIFIIILLRGFVSGFGAGVMFGILGVGGGSFMGLGLVVKDVLIIPPLLGIAVNAINFSKKIFKGLTIKSLTRENFKQSLLSYCILTLVFAMIILFGVFVESYTIPYLISFSEKF